MKDAATIYILLGLLERVVYCVGQQTNKVRKYKDWRRRRFVFVYTFRHRLSLPPLDILRLRESVVVLILTYLSCPSETCSPVENDFL